MGADKEKRVHRTTALNGIREQFNPFEYRMPAKGPKFEVMTSSGIESRNGKGIIRRPGVANSRDQERVIFESLHYINLLTGTLA